MPKFSALTLSFLALAFVTICYSQNVPSSPYLARVEHQTRSEDVCMLVLSDGHFHLERTEAGGARIFEGTLPPAALSELQPLLSANKLVDLKQSQIDSTPTGEVDQMMLTVPRAAGWQTLTFPTPKSRKPVKAELDPILKWLDRNKQQQNPIAGAIRNRCVPPQTTRAARGFATPNASNPYLMRILIDHYEPKGSGTAFSIYQGVTGESFGGVETAEAMDTSSFKITRTCAVVYQNNRYRFEKNVRDAGVIVKSEVFRDSLSQTQVDELRQILDNPKLAALPNSSAPNRFGREGELINLAIARDKTIQGLAFATFGPRPASADLNEVAFNALAANAGMTNPIRKWVKQNLEENKSALAKDVPATNCTPSAQPE